MLILALKANKANTKFEIQISLERWGKRGANIDVHVTAPLGAI